ncbi:MULTISPECIES: methyltransferase domain-containing protein [Pacificimonas]|uniref:Methyltransferase domain-containing protein n=1 Tax=Pacificimonas aurantium TaxID=1250540 RepID=A0ABS7WMQ5_9SPHN|nr:MULTISPECIES: methyltransferase domain-containing protein [Pacificimonas]MBZ6379680.1 methyltransferase domain-containing protein [Pacificimonas aurantium]
MSESQTENAAKTYYDSPDADAFYSAVWGGEDIHVGLYDDVRDIRTASRQTVDRMLGKILPVAGKKVVDLGSGYGGAARVLAGEHDADVTCINIAEVENRRNRELTAKAGLDDRVRIIDGSFDDIPCDTASFDVAWSQDAILHAPDRDAVLDEVARVLKPGGEFIFTDPMQADRLEDAAALQPIYDRIHLPDLASFAFYDEALTARGFEPVEVEKMPAQLGRHYGRVREELEARRDELPLDPEFVDRMLSGLKLWVDGAADGKLAWGIMHYRKAA